MTLVISLAMKLVIELTKLVMKILVTLVADRTQ